MALQGTGIQDPKTVFGCKIRQNMRLVKFFKDSLVKSTNTNLSWKHKSFADFQWILMDFFKDLQK